MTTLLDDAIARVRTLPNDRQDEIAWVIFDFIGSEVVDPSQLPLDYRKTVETWLQRRDIEGQGIQPSDLRALYRSLV